MSLRILIAEEEQSFRESIADVLEGHEIVKAMEASGGDPFALVITGMDALEEARTLHPDALVVATVDPARASEASHALRSGAHDCLVRSCEKEMIEAVLRRTIQRIELAQENRALLGSLKLNVEALGRQNKRLEHLATRDGLTGLYNHRYFRNAFEVELSRCRRHDRVVSLVFADIDHFKRYNDTHGHLAGDKLLTRLGKLITKKSRKTTVIARYGGEEFVLLVPETDNDGALRYAEKIRALVESEAGGEITLSMGVATFPQHGEDADALIKHADDALYRAKDCGRNTVCG